LRAFYGYFTRPSGLRVSALRRLNITLRIWPFGDAQAGSTTIYPPNPLRRRFSHLSLQFTYWVGGLLVEHLKVLLLPLFTHPPQSPAEVLRRNDIYNSFMHNDIENIEISLLALGSARPSGPSLTHISLVMYEMTYIMISHKSLSFSQEHLSGSEMTYAHICSPSLSFRNRNDIYNIYRNLSQLYLRSALRKPRGIFSCISGPTPNK